MTREWKPGDLISVPFSRGRIRAFVQPGCGAHTEHGEYWTSRSVEAFDMVRPLVVIDPESREDVERLARGYVKTWLGPREGVSPETVGQMQAALREYANPTPPRLEEPTGLGAVVEDAEGGRWIRRDVHAAPWANAAGNAFPVTWASIDAVHVLSAGWSE